MKANIGNDSIEALFYKQRTRHFTNKRLNNKDYINNKIKFKGTDHSSYPIQIK